MSAENNEKKSNEPTDATEKINLLAEELPDAGSQMAQIEALVATVAVNNPDAAPLADLNQEVGPKMMELG
jgi:hypothetical protein